MSNHNRTQRVASCKVEMGGIQLRWGDPLTLLPKSRRDGICLDLGSGRGRYKRAIEEKGYQWVGLDFEMPKDGKISIVGDAHFLPFPNRIFDSVFMCFVLEHMYNPWRAVSEVYRVLKEGGVFCGNVAFLEPWFDSYCHFTHMGVERILKDAGFTEITLKPGPIFFATMGHHLFGISGNKLVPSIVRFLVPLFLLFWKLFAKWHTIAKFGRNSKMYGKYLRFFEIVPLRYAGNIWWQAKKF